MALDQELEDKEACHRAKNHHGERELRVRTDLILLSLLRLAAGPLAAPPAGPPASGVDRKATGSGSQTQAASSRSCRLVVASGVDRKAMRGGVSLEGGHKPYFIKNSF